MMAATSMKYKIVLSSLSFAFAALAQNQTQHNYTPTGFLPVSVLLAPCPHYD